MFSYGVRSERMLMQELDYSLLPERTYELLTAQLKARVMEMWLEMRDSGQRQAAD